MSLNKQRGNIMERLKLRIAQHLDKNPSYCWANLVMWAMGYSSTRELLSDGTNGIRSQICRKSNPNTPYAYCNKCEVTGKYYEKIKVVKGDVK